MRELALFRINFLSLQCQAERAGWQVAVSSPCLDRNWHLSRGGDSFTKLFFFGNWNRRELWGPPEVIAAALSLASCPCPTCAKGYSCTLSNLLIQLKYAANKKAWGKYPSAPSHPGLLALCIVYPDQENTFSDSTCGGQAALLYTAQASMVKSWSVDTKE